MGGFGSCKGVNVSSCISLGHYISILGHPFLWAPQFRGGHGGVFCFEYAREKHAQAKRKIK